MGKFDEIKGQTLEALNAMKETLSKEIFELASELSVARKLDQPHLLRAKKREKARVMTAMTMKKRGMNEEQS